HQTTNRNGSSNSGSTRPRRTASGTATVVPAPQPSPARSPTNQLLYPIDLSREIGEPPAWPTPKPTPTPAAQTTAPASSTVRPAESASSIGEEIDPADVVRINSNLVTIPTSVVDASGRAVTDLK